ncbi:MAG: methyltransferase domain-containing protein [Candidatus Competibacteraceae bacterium]|nr:methyltransferase domain-containing protein [Candidatus Competibacteraceae bacterium]
MSKSNAPSRPKPARNSRKHVSAPPQIKSTNGFYRAFEERHRGPRDLIKHRLSVYLPFVEPLRQIHPRCTAIDLGCGRGEWLELLQKNGFEAQGVDLDDGMLAVCTELGLTVTRQEAIEHLKSLDDNSQCIVSGFHFVEHIPFADLRVLITEALRVLRPGGLLILETPNPENVVVGTTNFYLDPTHQRPIPPLLLSFLPEYQGFERVKILRLQESPDLAGREGITLKDVFFGASPDYAIVAQKDAPPKILLRFSTAFDKHYGIGLGDLTDHYDARIAGRFAALDQRVGNAESAAGGMVDALSRIYFLQDRLIEATTQFERSQSHATQLAEKLHHSKQLAQEQERRAEAAEGRAQEQERRAEAAEGRAQEQERRAEAAEGRAQEQERRAEAAEGRAQEQERRAEAAEGRAQEQERRAEAAEGRAQEQERRAEAAESRAQQAEARIHQTEANLAQSSQEFQALHQANHYHWQLAEERNQYSQALLNSISWRITAPLRSMGRAVIWLRGQAAMPQSSPYNAQSALRRTAVSMVNWGVSYAQKAPRFRRVVLTVLNRMPGLTIKLRQMHIQSQFAPHPHHGDWSGNQIPMPAGQTSSSSGSDANRLHSIPLSDGINARQRTPLETYFHVYRGSE